MNINEVLTLSEVAEKYKVPVETLRYRLKNLEEGTDYRRLGVGQSIIITKEAVKKLVKGCSSYIVLRGEE
jgi:predicted transcriptional regulator